MTRIQKIAQGANFFALKLGLLKADNSLKNKNKGLIKDTVQIKSKKNDKNKS